MLRSPGIPFTAPMLSARTGILVAHVLDCQTDEQAISKAKEYGNDNCVKLWNQGRKIALIPLGSSTCIVL